MRVQALNRHISTVFAIGQDGERRIKVWYDTPLGRAKSYSGR